MKTEKIEPLPQMTPLRTLAGMAGIHHTNVMRDLKKRRYNVVAIRTVEGQKAHALTKEDADRYLAERRAEGFWTKRPPLDATITTTFAETTSELAEVAKALAKIATALEFIASTAKMK